MIQYKRSHHKNLKQIQERIGKPKDIWKATEHLDYLINLVDI